jgi:hypothetical protein
MKTFQERTYALSEKGLLVWEPSWDTFRPVKSVVWNPAHQQIEPYYGVFIHDIFDIHYGYNTEELHNFCIEYTDENLYDIRNAEPITNIQDFWRWCGSKLEWNRDQAISLHPCSESTFDRSKFLERLGLRSKTYKRAPRNIKGTRKVIPQ